MAGDYHRPTMKRCRSRICSGSPIRAPWCCGATPTSSGTARNFGAASRTRARSCLCCSTASCRPDACPCMSAGRQLRPMDPYLRRNPLTQDRGFEDLEYDGHRIRVNPVVLPHPSRLSREEACSRPGRAACWAARDSTSTAGTGWSWPADGSACRACTTRHTPGWRGSRSRSRPEPTWPGRSTSASPRSDLPPRWRAGSPSSPKTYETARSVYSPTVGPRTRRAADA